MTYHQITREERYTVGLLRQQGLAPATIARVLGRHRSTIGREVRRNGTPRDGCYRPQLADWYAQGRRSWSRRNQRFSTQDWERIQALVREDWSPEQIAGRLQADQELAISHETIYRYLWADKAAGGTLYRHLRGAASSAASATAATTAAAAWRANARSPRARRSSRRDASSGIGKATRCSARAKRDPAC